MHSYYTNIFQYYPNIVKIHQKKLYFGLYIGQILFKHCQYTDKILYTYCPDITQRLDRGVLQI